MNKLTLFVLSAICLINYCASEKVVVCYYGTWATYRYGLGKFDVSNINPDLCTHIVYTFVGINSQGTVISLDPYLDLPDNWGRSRGRDPRSFKTIDVNPFRCLKWSSRFIKGWADAQLNSTTIANTLEAWILILPPINLEDIHSISIEKRLKKNEAIRLFILFIIFLFLYFKPNFIRACIDFETYIDNFGKFVSLKQQNPKLKAILAVGGWNEASAKYSVMAASPTLRKNFINSALEMILQHGFDGLDFDWEYPNRRDTVNGQADVNNFIQLLKELREEFDKYGFILTAAVASVKSAASQSYDIPSIVQYLDLVNVMTYDMYGAWDPQTGHNAPLHKGEGDENSNKDDLNTVDVALDYWLSQGCPSEKLVLGVPFYGHTFQLSNVNNNGVRAASVGPGLAGPYTATSGTIGYNELCQKLRTESWVERYDSLAKVPYAVQGQNWVSYDDANSIVTKIEYALKLNVGGVMVWSIETDDFHGICHTENFPLLRAINRVLGRATDITTSSTESSKTTTATPETTLTSTIKLPSSSTASSTMIPSTEESSTTWSTTSAVSTTEISTSYKPSPSYSPTWSTSTPLSTTETSTSYKPSSTISPSYSPTWPTSTPISTTEKPTTNKPSSTTVPSTYEPSSSTSSASTTTPVSTTEVTSTILPSTTTLSTTTPVPTESTLPSSTGSTVVSYVCENDGLYPNPNDCTSFYVCVRNAYNELEPVHLQCPDNLYWDDKNKYCNYPNLVDCKLS